MFEARCGCCYWSSNGLSTCGRSNSWLVIDIMVVGYFECPGGILLEASRKAIYLEWMAIIEELAGRQGCGNA